MTDAILRTSDEFISAIQAAIDNEKEPIVHISTFSIWAGVLEDGRYTPDWGGNYANRIGTTLTILNNNPKASAHIIVGNPHFKDCPLQTDKRCSVGNEQEKWAGRFKEMKKKWGRIEWIHKTQHHTKMVLISPDVSIIGGRNFTQPVGDWDDLSFVIRDQSLYDELMEEWVRLADG